MPFEKGNKLGGKSRQFEKLLISIGQKDDWQRLRQGVEKLFTLASEGERWALEMIRDTVDGKPTQAITGEDGGPIVIAGIQVQLVRPGDPQS